MNRPYEERESTLPSPTRASVTPPLAGEAMAALGPHPALRATFPVSGEGFDGGDGLPHQCEHWFAMTGVGRCGRRAIRESPYEERESTLPSPTRGSVTPPLAGDAMAARDLIRRCAPSSP